VRGFLLGLVLLSVLAVSVLAFRPGGLRRQLRLVARRFRIVLVLGGAYVFGSLVIRLLFTSGPVNEWGPIALALLLVVVFVFVAADPAT
jgi:hypothetical protein